jgi:hypothetical protein
VHKSGPQKKQCSEELQVYTKSLSDFSERNIIVSKEKSLNRKKTIWVLMQRTKAGLLWHLRLQQMLQNGPAL